MKVNSVQKKKSQIQSGLFFKKRHLFPPPTFSLFDQGQVCQVEHYVSDSAILDQRSHRAHMETGHIVTFYWDMFRAGVQNGSWDRPSRRHVATAALAERWTGRTVHNVSYAMNYMLCYVQSTQGTFYVLCVGRASKKRANMSPPVISVGLSLLAALSVLLLLLLLLPVFLVPPALYCIGRLVTSEIFDYAFSPPS